MIRRNLSVMLVCTLLATSGCTALRSVPIGASSVDVNAGLAPGRKVVIVLKSGVEIDGRVVSSDEMGLVIRSSEKGKTQQLAFADMQSVDVRRVSWPRTLGVIGGGFVILIGVALHQYKSGISEALN